MRIHLMSQKIEMTNYTSVSFAAMKQLPLWRSCVEWLLHLVHWEHSFHGSLIDSSWKIGMHPIMMNVIVEKNYPLRICCLQASDGVSHHNPNKKMQRNLFHNVHSKTLHLRSNFGGFTSDDSSYSPLQISSIKKNNVNTE